MKSGSIYANNENISTLTRTSLWGAGNISNALIPVIVAGATLFPFSVKAFTPIPTVVVRCDSCLSYNDLSNFALNTSYQIGNGRTPTGFAAGMVSKPGYTKILVFATTVPMSFTFDYNQFTVMGFTVSQVSPATSLSATDDGAVSHDFMLAQAKRASGLPIINLPPTDVEGAPLNETAPPDNVSAFISYTVFRNGQPGVTTLPGLLNWNPLPVVRIIYGEKLYVLYEGDEFTAKFSNGTTVVFKVRVGRFGATAGFLDFGKVTPAPSGPIVILQPPSPGSFAGVSLPSLDNNSLTLSGVPIYIYGNGPQFTSAVTVTTSQSTDGILPAFTWSYIIDIG